MELCAQWASYMEYCSYKYNLMQWPTTSGLNFVWKNMAGNQKP